MTPALDPAEPGRSTGAAIMRIGVDLGGTKIEAVALADDGSELARERIASPRGSYEATLAAVARLVSRVESMARALAPRAGLASVGMGIPGAISPASGLVKNANSTWLIGQPLGTDLERVLGRPVRIENDANCFAVSEAADGAGAGAEVVFGVILGTGVGAGIVVRGAVLRGAMAIAGEWGHNRLPASDDRDAQAAEWPGALCYCGRRGCIETYLSGPGWVARHGEDVRARPYPDAEALVTAALAGEPSAAASYQRYIDRLARALASVINVLDPDVIVLGGGLGRIADLYTAIPRRWDRYIFSDRITTRLEPPRHGDASGVRGAAWLWPAAGAGR